jgi:spore maturation protein CgeB
VSTKSKQNLNGKATKPPRKMARIPVIRKGKIIEKKRPQNKRTVKKPIKEERLKILVLIKPFETVEVKRFHPVVEGLKQFAEVRYWSEDGSILDILKRISWKPNFIFHYDYAESYSYSPRITDLNKVDIPKGCYVLNIDERPEVRRAYIIENNVDLLYAASKDSFLEVYPECEDRFRELPSPIQPDVKEDRKINSKPLTSYTLVQNDYSAVQCAQQLIATIKDYVNMKHLAALIRNGKVPRKKKLKILILIKKFGQTMPKHQHKYDMVRAIRQFAQVSYWHKNGDIRNILKKIKMKPDFIFHYDISWNYAFAPKITNLSKVKIPKGCYVLDIHWRPNERKAYFDKIAKPNLIFSASKYPFLKAFPECNRRFRWAPFAINPNIIRDYKENKDIDFSLMGLLHPPGRYPFRETVLNRMTEVNGFVHFKHPGHHVQTKQGVLINTEYARVINRTKLFFTCGSQLEIPVAKFFEGPGCRALLMAEPNRDILDLGFKDKVNFIACDGENLARKANYYQTNHLERELITQNGYDFIQTHHTNQVRANQFVAAIEELLKRKK